MSEKHTLTIPAHHNIYTGSSTRELRIEFCVPKNGVNENTGLVILVPGFGGNIDSKVYVKMRETFADKYNLVTIQCDYFGSSFMQSAESFTVKDQRIINSILSEDDREVIAGDTSKLIARLADRKLILPVQAKINENLEQFNDMSYMQSIDIITALEAVQIILHDNNLRFNDQRVIGYGHSHGAYLIHLCNRLVPNLFSYIVDNSAWVEPVYLTHNRLLYKQIGELTLAVEFEYLAKRIIKRKKDLHLSNLYKKFRNSTQILTFQGDNDNLIRPQEKQRIISNINNTKFILVTKEDVDQIKYRSNTHGLNADFLELFSYALEFEESANKIKEGSPSYAVELNHTVIEVDFTHGLPVFSFNYK